MSRNIRKRAPRTIVKCIAPSRRNPDGYYSVLEVPTNATTQEILKSWRRLALRAHPDRGTTAADRSGRSRRMQRLNEAKDVLVDPDLRLAYDKKFCFVKESDSNSTTRVRIHRQGLDRESRKKVSAVTACRARLLPNRRDGGKRRKFCKKGNSHRMSYSKVNHTNNRFTGQWVFVRRTRAERTADKRRGPFACYIQQEIINS